MATKRRKKRDKMEKKRRQNGQKNGDNKAIKMAIEWRQNGDEMVTKWQQKYEKWR